MLKPSLEYGTCILSLKVIVTNSQLNFLTVTNILNLWIHKKYNIQYTSVKLKALQLSSKAPGSNQWPSASQLESVLTWFFSLNLGLNHSGERQVIDRHSL